MLGRLTSIGCVQRQCRDLCRQVVLATRSQYQGLASVATAGSASVRDEPRPELRKSGANLLTANGTSSHVLLQVPQRFASKASASMGRKLKRETYDRYLGLDPSRMKHGFDEVPELQDASEDVRKIFSLQFASGSEIKKVQRSDTFDDVGIDPNIWGFSNFLVTSIARLTVTIRNQAPHVERFPRDKKNKRRFLMSIDHRRKLIKALRRTDFSLACRLLDKLGLEFSPDPVQCRRQTRRSAEKRALCRQAFGERAQALEAFRGQLRAEQMAEIAQLKVELGLALTEEEEEAARRD